LAASGGKVVMFKYKKDNNGQEDISDYKFRIDSTMIQFYLESLSHLAKNVYGIKIYAEELNLSKKSD